MWHASISNWETGNGTIKFKYIKMVISFHISLPVLFRVVLIAEHQANKHRQVQNDIKIKKITHYDVIKWKHFRRYWPVVRGIHRSRENSTHKGQWRVALKFYLICAWVNIGEAGNLKCHRAHYEITEGLLWCTTITNPYRDVKEPRVKKQLWKIVT